MNLPCITTTFMAHYICILYCNELFYPCLQHLFTGTLHQSALHSHYVGIVESQVTWPATVPMRESAIHAIRLVIEPETAQLLVCNQGT